MPRQKDKAWNAGPCSDGETTHEQARLAVLMDLRDELKLSNVYLQAIRNTLCCSNAVDIPNILRRISRHVAKPKKGKHD